jgi:hypothetical protein
MPANRASEARTGAGAAYFEVARGKAANVRFRLCVTSARLPHVVALVALLGGEREVAGGPDHARSFAEDGIELADVDEHVASNDDVE